MKRKEIEDFELECWEDRAGLVNVTFDCPNCGAEIDNGWPHKEIYTRCEKCGARVWLEFKLFVKWDK